MRLAQGGTPWASLLCVFVVQSTNQPKNHPRWILYSTSSNLPVAHLTGEGDMAKENSFDITSKVDLEEVSNAVHQTMKEVGQRFDFKGSQSDIKLEDSELVLVSDDDYKLQALTDILQQKLVKRKVPLKALSYGKIESALGGTLRQRVGIQQGITTEKAKEIVRFIRDTKLKVKNTIQGDSVRVSSRDRDTLQESIALIKEKDFGIDVQFTNYRNQ